MYIIKYLKKRAWQPPVIFGFGHHSTEYFNDSYASFLEKGRISTRAKMLLGTLMLFPHSDQFILKGRASSLAFKYWSILTF